MTKTAGYSPETLGLIDGERLFETERLGLVNTLAEVLTVAEKKLTTSLISYLVGALNNIK